MYVYVCIYTYMHEDFEFGREKLPGGYGARGAPPYMHERNKFAARTALAALVFEVHRRIYKNATVWPQKTPRRHWCSKCTAVYIKMYQFGHKDA